MEYIKHNNNKWYNGWGKLVPKLDTPFLWISKSHQFYCLLYKYPKLDILRSHICSFRKMSLKRLILIDWIGLEIGKGKAGSGRRVYNPIPITLSYQSYWKNIWYEWSQHMFSIQIAYQWMGYFFQFWMSNIFVAVFKNKKKFI